MNTPISFEISKLLKEKGFNNYTTSQYIQFNSGNDGWKLKTNQEYQELDLNVGIGDNIRISAPAIAEVVMWLYEKHGIWISVKKDYHNGALLGFESVIDNEDGFIDCGTFDSPTEAYEAAIKYVLENLI